MIEPGSVIGGKYRILHQLGRGGMGVVMAAEHVDLRTQLALKFLGDKYLEHPQIIERFLREARSCAQLRSEHICRVFDVDRLDNGLPYIVMELLEGRDLNRVLRKQGALHLAQAAEYVAQACSGLSEAHAAGIVHRDLKPSNLFLTTTESGELIKVLDFGVAKAQGETDHSLTGAGNVVGSPTYMAPEQLRSAKGADARSDVWSLGVILYELVVGRPPWSGETLIDLAMRISHEPPETPTGVPPQFGNIIARCLQKDPKLRFQSVDELAAELRPFLPSDSLAAIRRTPPRLTPPPGALAQAAATPAPSTALAVTPSITTTPLALTTLNSASGVVHTTQTAASRRWFMIGAVAAISIGVSAALFVNERRSQSTSPAAVTPAAAPTTPEPAPMAMPVVDEKPPAPPPPPPPAPEPTVQDEEIEHLVDMTAVPAKPPAAKKAPAKKKPLKVTKDKVGASRY